MPTPLLRPLFPHLGYFRRFCLLCLQFLHLQSNLITSPRLIFLYVGLNHITILRKYLQWYLKAYQIKYKFLSLAWTRHSVKDAVVCHPDLLSVPKHSASIPQMLVVLASDKSEFNSSPEIAIDQKELFGPRFVFPQRQTTFNKWLLWEYKGPAPLSQFRTTLYSYTNFSVACGIRWSPCCNLILTQLVPLSWDRKSVV